MKVIRADQEATEVMLNAWLREYGDAPEPFVLRQLWVSDIVGEDDQWRDIELVA